MTVVLRGSYIESITSGGETVHHTELKHGASTGVAEFLDEDGYAMTAADGRNLATYFARSSTSADWQVDLTGWQNFNGGDNDFFVFEVGGNDALMVTPIFPNGSYGQEVSIGGWSDTNYHPQTGPNAGQEIRGLAFRHSKLRDANGNPLSDSAIIGALRFRSPTIDGASFLAVDPEAMSTDDGDGSYAFSCSPRAGQPFEIHFQGPWASETDVDPNPFLDYRFNVLFTGPEGRRLFVPGFFDADGRGGDSGNTWKVRFTPDIEGPWSAVTDLRVGTNVATGVTGDVGSPGPILNEIVIPFSVAPLDPNAPGLNAKGTLRYVGEHYMRFDDGSYFIKTGTNSPENLLGYRGFEGPGKSPNAVGIHHRYEPHVVDWEPGDPLFISRDYETDAKGLIGAINWIASKGANSMHAMLMNLGGDGNDAFPFLGTENDAFTKRHYDTGRLLQWNAVFEHAARKGIALHVSLGETEPANETWLDNGQLGIERKLFYREMVARFGHNQAVKWTLTEENDFSANRLREFAAYIAVQDVYNHPITFHNFPNDFAEYAAVLGDDDFSATAFQYHANQISNQIEAWRENSTLAGRPWVMDCDEQTPWNVGAVNGNSVEMRKSVLYDVLFSGGSIEWYGGWYDLPLGGDLTLEDFRTRVWIFENSARARTFMQENLPFTRMKPDDNLLSGESGLFGGGEVFALEGLVYAIYLPDASPSGAINLSNASGQFRQRWYNPREGRFEGSESMVNGGGSVSLGNPPDDANDDWIVLIDRPVDFDDDI
ncbi:MAG: DUF5060 domain-containing protein [bacterium]|nr:DUF5060 domain-containing protein [bacterium]